MQDLGPSSTGYVQNRRFSTEADALPRTSHAAGGDTHRVTERRHLGYSGHTKSNGRRR